MNWERTGSGSEVECEGSKYKRRAQNRNVLKMALRFCRGRSIRGIFELVSTSFKSLCSNHVKKGVENSQNPVNVVYGWPQVDVQ